MHLERELARCDREDSSLAVMVCDLNGFKKVNDRFGHLAGDQVLKIFAKSVQSECRGYDYVARMGGDEFVIIGTTMTPSAISKRAALLSSLAAQAGRAVCGEDVLSLSLGAAFYPRDGLDTAQLLAEADKKGWGFFGRKKPATPDLRAEPVVASRAAPRQAQAPAAQASSGAAAPPSGEDLFPEHNRDEQFEIPAFLRRQSN